MSISGRVAVSGEVYLKNGTPARSHLCKIEVFRTVRNVREVSQCLVCIISI